MYRHELKGTAPTVISALQSHDGGSRICDNLASLQWEEAEAARPPLVTVSVVVSVFIILYVGYEAFPLTSTVQGE